MPALPPVPPGDGRPVLPLPLDLTGRDVDRGARESVAGHSAGEGRPRRRAAASLAHRDGRLELVADHAALLPLPLRLLVVRAQQHPLVRQRLELLQDQLPRPDELNRISVELMSN